MKYFVKFKDGSRVEVEANSKQEALDLAYEKYGEEGEVFDNISAKQKSLMEPADIEKNLRSDMLEQERLKQLREKNEQLLRSQMGNIGNIALSTYKFIAPDAATETLEGKEPGVGYAKSAGKTALGVASMMVPVARVPSVIGRLGVGGGLGTAEYLGEQAIGAETPTLSGAGIGFLTGLVGQGAGEGLQQIGKRLVGKTLNLSTENAGKLLESGDIGLFSSKDDVIKSIKDRIKVLKTNREEILQDMQEGTIDIDAAKQHALDLIDAAQKRGDISFKQGDAFAKDLTEEFNNIKFSFQEGITPSYAFNRAQAMEKSIPTGAESIQDIKTGTGLKGYFGGAGLRTQLDKTISQVQPITSEIDEYARYLKDVSKSRPALLDLTSPGTYGLNPLLYQGGKVIPQGVRLLQPTYGYEEND